MRTHILKRTALGVGITGLTLAVAVTVFIGWQQRNSLSQAALVRHGVQDETSTVDAEEQLWEQDKDMQLQSRSGLPVGLPERLIIPEIDVDAPVVEVGLTPAGKMDVPKNPGDVAWYEPGTRPGQEGSAVLAGHYGTWQNGQGSVFDELHTLREGDKIYVEDAQGQRTGFVVRESRRFDPDADATEVFTSNDGKAHLNLVTCEGDWNADAQRFSKRRVIFADKL